MVSVKKGSAKKYTRRVAPPVGEKKRTHTHTHTHTQRERKRERDIFFFFLFSNCASLSILKKKKKSVVPLSSNFKKHTRTSRARRDRAVVFRLASLYADKREEDHHGRSREGTGGGVKIKREYGLE